MKLDAGATYLVATGQTGGAVFPLDGLNRVVLDGNGATFDVRAVDLDRRGVELFVASDVRSVVLADFRTRSEAWNSTFGTILEVSPPQDGNQTVTFRLEEGQASPLALIPSGDTPGYAYDANVPGRLAAGTWSHYPPAPVRPNLEATADPRIFRHTVTRTDRSIPRGEAAGEPGKWLVKQKKAGVLLLTVRNTAEDVTLCGVVSGGATNGVLRLWGGSGVNVLGCRFEPPPGRWISTSSDGFHGRAREAVWLEDVVIAGVCEDVLNLYATPMGVAAAGTAGGMAVTLLDLSRNDSAPGGFRTSEPAPGTIRPGRLAGLLRSGDRTGPGAGAHDKGRRGRAMHPFGASRGSATLGPGSGAEQHRGLQRVGGGGYGHARLRDPGLAALRGLPQGPRLPGVPQHLCRHDGPGDPGRQ